MYKVSVQQHFDAAHYLRGYHGKCENLHGHCFRVVVSLQSLEVNEIGLAYDFVELKQHLATIINRFDHTYLNEVSPFDNINPTSENIARVIYDELQSRLVGAPASVSLVEVGESPECCVAYRP